MKPHDYIITTDTQLLESDTTKKQQKVMIIEDPDVLHKLANGKNDNTDYKIIGKLPINSALLKTFVSQTDNRNIRFNQ